MATKNLTFGGGTGKDQIDLIDVGALMLLPMAASFLFQVFTLEINVFGSYDLTSPIWVVGGMDVTIVLIVASASSAWILATNLLNDQTEHEQEELAAIGAAISLPVLYELIPAVHDLVMWNDLAQLAAVIYVSAAAVYVSFKA